MKREYFDVTGVYQIRNLINNKTYIGSASGKGGIKKRLDTHRSRLRSDKPNQHHSTHLQRAWNKYRESSFIFEILEVCDPEQCLEREQHYLDIVLFASENDDRFRQLGYNSCRVAGSTRGIRWSEASKNKAAKDRQGHNNNFFGKKHSKETKRQIGSAGIGNKYAAKLLQRDVDQIRMLLTEEIKQKVIAGIYDVTHQTISKIKTNKRWKM